MGVDADTLTIYWLVFAGAWAALTIGVVWHLWLQRGAEQTPANRVRACIIILLVALGARVGVVWFTEPQLSNDINRYIRDGYVVAHGENPYRHVPATDPDDRRVSPQDPQFPINHPHLVTIYQPTSQWIFGATYTLAQSTQLHFHRAFRLMLILFDVGIVALLLRVLVRHGRSPWWAALYAWHPLAITEVAWSGHQDVIGIAFLLLAMVLLDGVRHGCAARLPERRIAIAGAAFALAVGVKPIVLPLALPMLWLMRGNARHLALASVTFIAMIVALYLPFALMEGGLSGMLETARIFARDWEFNGSVHLPLADQLERVRLAIDRLPYAARFTAMLGDFNSGKGWMTLIAGLSLLAMLAIRMRRDANLFGTALLYFFIMLLLSRTVHPWYLLWPLALLPLQFPANPQSAIPNPQLKNAALWVWSLTIAVSYAALINDAGYHVPAWLLWLQYIPVYALLAAAVAHNPPQARPLKRAGTRARFGF